MKKNKKILIIAERFYPEEFGINDLAANWHSMGYEVAVLTQTPSYPFGKVFKGYRNKLWQKEMWSGISIYRVFSLMGYNKSLVLKVLNYFSFSVLSSIASVCIGRKYDRIFVYHVGPLTQAIPGILMKKIFGKKLYIWTLDIWPDSVYAYGFRKRAILSSLLDSFVKSVYTNCETVFLSCKGFELRIRKYAPDTKMVFSPQWVPDGLNFENVIPHTVLNEGINFTFAGNIGKVQNLENIVKGFQIASESGRKMNLNFIGDGSNLEPLKKTVKEENIKNVHFWGRRPLEEMPKWFEASDVLIISLIDKPIFSLTVPAKFQAYLASGKPIFCVMRGEVAELISQNRLGFVSDPADINDIQLGFKTFLKTPKTDLNEFKTNMRRLLNKEYDKNKILKEMLGHIFSH